MHAARLSNSDRLQRVAELLNTGYEYSTLEIIIHANVCAVNSIISELRCNGMEIICRRQGGIWYYKKA